MILLEILCILGLLFMQNLCNFKGMIFRNLLYLGSFAKFCDVFFRILCLKDLLNCTCLG